jgi:hypothetical protein
VRRSHVSKIAAALATLVACGITAAAASATTQVYWAGYGENTVGVANLNGTGATPGFVTGGSTPCGNVAVSKNYIYWANYDGSSIGRATLTGSDVNQDFIGDADGACGVAVYAGHLYWVDYNDGTIGRANLDGIAPNQDFITGAIDPCGIAVVGKRVYWGNAANSSSSTIGRANLSGSGVKQNFIENVGEYPCYGMAVARYYIYWSNYEVGIGRADISGKNVNLDFVPGDDYMCGMAISPNYLYWGNYDAGTIGRSNLNGGDINQDFISDAPSNCGLAVGPPTTTIKLWVSKKPSMVGKLVNSTAAVTPLTDGGTVRFTDNGKTIPGCNAVTVSLAIGEASCESTYKSSGKNKIQATYSGDSDFYNSTSSAVTETVKP